MSQKSYVRCSGHGIERRRCAIGRHQDRGDKIGKAGTETITVRLQLRHGTEMSAFRRMLHFEYDAAFRLSRDEIRMGPGTLRAR